MGQKCVKLADRRLLTNWAQMARLPVGPSGLFAASQQSVGIPALTRGLQCCGWRLRRRRHFWPCVIEGGAVQTGKRSVCPRFIDTFFVFTAGCALAQKAQSCGEHVMHTRTVCSFLLAAAIAAATGSVSAQVGHPGPVAAQQLSADNPFARASTLAP